MRGPDHEVVFNADGSVRGFYRKMWLLPECALHVTIASPDVTTTKSGNLCCVGCKDKIVRDSYYSPEEGERCPNQFGAEIVDVATDPRTATGAQELSANPERGLGRVGRGRVLSYDDTLTVREIL